MACNCGHNHQEPKESKALTIGIMLFFFTLFALFIYGVRQQKTLDNRPNPGYTVSK